LHPRVLAEQGLAAALATLTRELPLPVELDVTTDQLPPPVAAVAYFVCAEALTNVAKHAAAARATVAITAGDGRLRVEIADDGVGGADPVRGSGLRGLADRVETLGGTLRVESTPGRGTRLAAEIPLGGEATRP
jgi:signal transduction histidine kinase